MIEVSWSEGTLTKVYRRYSDFFEFQVSRKCLDKELPRVCVQCKYHNIEAIVRTSSAQIGSTVTSGDLLLMLLIEVCVVLYSSTTVILTCLCASSSVHRT